MYKRCHQYIYDIKFQKTDHINIYLLRAVNKIGINNFEFFPLEFCKYETLPERELFWIKQYKTTDQNFGYNLRIDTISGMIPHDTTREKISNSLKNAYSEGRRSGIEHSKKLKLNWEDNPNRRKQQSKLFSQIKTKYEYFIYHSESKYIVINYTILKLLGYKNVIAEFHRRKSNDVMYKGIRIIRKSKGE